MNKQEFQDFADRGFIGESKLSTRASVVLFVSWLALFIAASSLMVYWFGYAAV